MAEIPKLTGTQLALGAGALVVGAGVAGVAIARSRRKKNRRRKTNRSKSVRKRFYRSKQSKRQRYTPHTAGKRKDYSRRRIRYTSKGQPYVIGKGGRARFIKRSSAKRSHKQSGGRY